MRWRVAVLAAGILILATVEAVLLTRKGDWERCTGKDLEVRILGCTAIIQSGQQTQENLARAFELRGWTYANTRQYDLAIQDEDQAIRLSPNDAFAFQTRGAAYFEKGQYDRAIEDFDQVIKQNPDHATAFGARGTAYNRKGQNDRAIDDLDQAIKLKPDYADAFAARGTAHSDKGEHDLAVEDFKRALALDPRNAAARNGLQIAAFGQAFEHPPNQTNPAFYLIERGNLYAQMGRTDRAMQDYDEAIKLDPHDLGAAWRAEPFLGRARLYAETAQYDRAIQDYSEAIRLFPNATAFSARGDAFRALGEQDRAAADFAEAKLLNEARANEARAKISIMDKFFPPLMIIGLASPLVAIMSTFIFYGLHCNHVAPEHRVSAVGYAILVAACGVAAGFFGLIFGVERACSFPGAPNLCGLWGFFVTGPLSFSLAIFLVGASLYLVRPSQSSGGT